MGSIDNLRIYKKALELVKKVYQLIKENPQLAKDYSLCDQLKRAAVSVVTNISEGYFRSKKQSQHYLEIASGSANEGVTILKIINLVYEIDTHFLQEEYIVFRKTNKYFFIDI